MEFNPLYPELIVKNLEDSLKFYRDCLGFVVEYERPEERFVFLSCNKAQIMLLEDNANQHSRTGPLEYPRGQGVNFSIQTENLDKLAASLESDGYQLRIPIRDQWHRRNDTLLGERQLWVMDPDGYLLRFIQDLGIKAVENA